MLIKSRSILTAFTLILIISALSIVSFAYSISVQTQSSQGLGGVYFNVNGNYDIKFLGFSVVYADTDECTKWPEEVCNTKLIADDWQVSFLLIANKGAKDSSATVYIDTGKGYTMLGEIKFEGVEAETKCTFFFDCGGSKISSRAALYIVIP